MSELQNKLMDRILDGETIAVSEYVAIGNPAKIKVDSLKLILDELVIEYYHKSVRLGYLEVHQITSGAALATDIYRLRAKPWMTYEALGITIELIEAVMMLFAHLTPKQALYPGKHLVWDQAEDLAQRYAQRRAIERGELSPALLAKKSITLEELIAGKTIEEREVPNATKKD